MKPEIKVEPAVRLICKDELRQIAGGMMKIGEGKTGGSPGDEGTTWVPEGTVKVFLAGVQIN
jgi:hypothetical protein